MKRIDKRTTLHEIPKRNVILPEHLEPRPLGGYRVRAIPYSPYMKGRITKQRNISAKALQSIRDKMANAPHPEVVSIGGDIQGEQMPYSVSLVGTYTATVDKRIRAWSRTPTRQAPGETVYPTLVARLHMRDDETGELIDEQGPIACRIAWQVAKRFTRSRLAYDKTMAQAIAVHMLRRAGNNDTNDGFTAPDIKYQSFTAAMVTNSTLEEMTMAALLPLRIRIGELPMDIATRKVSYDYFPNGRGRGVSPVITAAYRAARKALVKELEHVGIGLLPAHSLNNLKGPPISPPTERELRQRDARAIRQRVYTLRKYIVRHWTESKSRKAKQGLQGDLRTLQMATRSYIGLPITYGRRSTLRARLNLLEARIGVEWSRAIAKRSAADRARAYRMRVHIRAGIR